MCVSVRHVNAAAGEEANVEYYKEMQEDVRRRNDRINIEKGLESPLLPLAVAYFKNHFHAMNSALVDSAWLAGDTFSLADISHGVYVTRMAGFDMAPLWADLTHLIDWHARFKARPSYEEGVMRWGDDTSPKRKKFAADAFPTLGVAPDRQVSLDTAVQAFRTLNTTTTGITNAKVKLCRHITLLR